MKDQPLSDVAITVALNELPGWARDGDALVKKFEFGDFRAALMFMMRVGFDAEDLDHHPEWSNVYNEVAIRLTTHHSGDKITDKDVKLASAIERVVNG